jgi:acyl-CoA synthetase (AMP-forming)/AMP-acid ligase II
VPQLLAWRALLHPDRVAIDVHGVDTLTFSQWEAGAAAIAGSLRRRGVARGDRVGLCFGTRQWTHFALAYCGVLRAGAVAVPLSDRLASGQIRHVWEHCHAKALIQESESTQDLLPGMWSATVAELTGTDSGPGLEPVVLGGDDLAQILYTSGTTGRPKGVMATHANLTTGALSDPRRLALGHSERFLHAFAIGTNAGQTMLFNALQARPTALTLAQFTPMRFARLIEASGSCSVFVVPSMAIELLNSGALAGRDLSGVQLVGSTAAALAPAVAARLAETFSRATIVNYYTSTEAAPAQTTMIFDRDHSDAVGRAIGGTLMIADSEGSALAPGETGEVWLRSPHPRAYYRDEAASRATFRGDWVRMGDVGRMDADGYLYLVDRQEDVVKSGAFKISTLEVEAALYENPHIAEVAVVPLAHPVLGASVAAAIVVHPRTPAGDVTLPALRAFLSTRLADYQLPSRVLVVDQLPRNDAGKVLKRQLIADFVELDETRRTRGQG